MNTLRNLLPTIRKRYHPLNGLRRHPLSHAVLSVVDVPVWVKLPGVKWKTRVRLVRHASSFLLPGGVEPGIFALFCAVGQQFGIGSFWGVGANVGYYTWPAKSIAPQAEVRMFEPDTENLELIRETKLRAGLRGITIRPVAVSDARGKRPFACDDVSGSTGGIPEGGATFSEREWGVTRRTLTVDTVSLEDERAAAGAVDLIKIDVEGHGEAVIRGGRGTIEEEPADPHRRMLSSR